MSSQLSHGHQEGFRAGVRGFVNVRLSNFDTSNVRVHGTMITDPGMVRSWDWLKSYFIDHFPAIAVISRSKVTSRRSICSAFHTKQSDYRGSIVISESVIFGCCHSTQVVIVKLVLSLIQIFVFAFYFFLDKEINMQCCAYCLCILLAQCATFGHSLSNLI